MTQAKVRLEPELATLTRSAWEGLIYEANLGAEDSDIARRYFIEKQCQIDIAIDKDMGHRTVNRKIGEMKRRLKTTYNRNIPS